MTDLLTELIAANRNLTPAHRAKLYGLGITPATLYRFTGNRLAGHFGVARIGVSDGLYEPDPDGAGAFLVGCQESVGSPLVDLVAFRLAEPAKWWLRSGDAVLLGLANARLAQFEDVPALVHPHPLAWLQDDCEGCVVLDWNADLHGYLDTDRIITTDDQTRERLQQSFQRNVHIPQIKSMETADAA